MKIDQSPNLKVIIIDDELNSRELLRTFLTSYCSDIDILGEAESVDSGLKLINRTQPDLLLLDIELDGGTGFDILSHLNNSSFLTCFVTGYDQYAIKAIKAGAFDYLLKPVNIQELKDMIEKAKNVISEQKETKDPTLIINESGKYIIIKVEEIIKIEVDGNFSFLYLSDKKRIISSEKLGYFEEVLPKTCFYRTHKSHIVNLKFIKSVEKSRTGNVLLQDNTQIPVASRRMKSFMDHLKTYKEAM